MDRFNRSFTSDDSRNIAVFPEQPAGILMSENDPIEEFLADEVKQFDDMLKSLDEFTFDEKEFDFLILDLPELPDIPDIPKLTRIKTEPKKSRTKRKRKTAANNVKEYPEFLQSLKKG